MVGFLKATVEGIGTKEPIIYVTNTTTGKESAFSLHALGLTSQNIDEMTAQFWACAQGRILVVWNNISRTMAEPVPWYLLPNRAIKEEIAAAFGSAC